jgi:RNA polymerase primary sigma factor
MAAKTQAKPEVAETREETADGPLMDSQTQAVKKMLARSKERGYVTYDELNAVLPPEQMSSEQIEDTLAMLSEIGINVVESEESEEPAPAAKKPKEDEEEAEEGQTAGNIDDDDVGRTDDPVRMYLREMGSVELLSREGEIAIAKRIEAGREAMIAGLCESPLTFQAIIIWRDELNEGKVFLRDIIDLEATYAGPDAKAMPAPVGPDGQPIPQPVGAAAAPGGLAQTPAPPAAPASATPFKPAS